MHKHDIIFRKTLHIIERFIATLTIVVLVGALAAEVLHLVMHPEAITDVHEFLNNILTIVIGLEFVRMLIDLTPGNTVEVLIMATARHIIMNHDNPITNLIGIACIAGLFATRRYLIPRSEMKEEMVEIE